MRRELTTLAAALGVSFVSLERAVGARASNLARVVLTLLLRHGPDVRSLVEHHGLLRGLPLALLSGVPVWDRAGHDDRRVRRPAEVSATARGIAAFLCEAAGRRPLVLVVDPSALNDPLAAAVVARLRRVVCRTGPRSKRGGLVLALPE